MSKSLLETVRVFFFAFIITASLAGANCGGSSGGGSDDDSAPSNNAPVVEQAFAPVSADEDTTAYVGEVSTHFSDPDGDALTYSVQGFTSVNAALAGDTIQLSAPADWNGSETGSVSACDTDGACASTPLEVEFTPVNDPPAVSGIPDVSMAEDETLTTSWSLDDYADAVEAADSELAWSYSGNSNI
ncbi:MAG: Ig-like domain-containing protein, partial [bacterium]